MKVSSVVTGIKLFENPILNRGSMGKTGKFEKSQILVYS